MEATHGLAAIFDARIGGARSPPNGSLLRMGLAANGPHQFIFTAIISINSPASKLLAVITAPAATRSS
jgi:hypothetical protein